jgi:orotate phosphoribosyltransferase
VLAIERARESGLIVIGAICLVDREMGAEAKLQDMQCPFERVFRFAEIVQTP